ncbi:hypothetical protein [Streptomyces griseoloalbus]|uniref:hypothetical protein n=1 Tax=Streptomyces griseoloalbus TaxID=67303 RepID=UPI00161420E7|nr:hypothetical protein [Streptomyces albaduncus]
MRTPWIVSVVPAAALLGACTDPSSGPGAGPPAPASPQASATTHQRSPASAGAAAVDPPTVLHPGDSLAMENREVLGRELRGQVRARCTGAPHSGTTLCDYLEGFGERSLVPASDKAAGLVRSLPQAGALRPRRRAPAARGGLPRPGGRGEAARGRGRWPVPRLSAV